MMKIPGNGDSHTHTITEMKERKVVTIQFVILNHKPKVVFFLSLPK